MFMRSTAYHALGEAIIVAQSFIDGSNRIRNGLSIQENHPQLLRLEKFVQLLR